MSSSKSPELLSSRSMPKMRQVLRALLDDTNVF
jgi:hypothetical protein